MWYTESGSDGAHQYDGVVRVDMSGRQTFFPTPTPNSYPLAIVPGLDGNIWFGEDGAGIVGRITRLDRAARSSACFGLHV